jgi:hypothetical protein
MASGVQGPKQTRGYFVALSALPSTQQFMSSGSGGAGGSYLPGVMTPGGNTASGNAGVIASGSVLKDMGKTVVSSTHTFRKVQLVVAGGPAFSTNVTAANTGAPFYIELVTGQSAQATAASVAYLPGLM